MWGPASWGPTWGTATSPRPPHAPLALGSEIIMIVMRNDDDSYDIYDDDICDVDDEDDD